MLDTNNFLLFLKEFVVDITNFKRIFNSPSNLHALHVPSKNKIIMKNPTKKDSFTITLHLHHKSKFLTKTYIISSKQWKTNHRKTRTSLLELFHNNIKDQYHTTSNLLTTITIFIKSKTTNANLETTSCSLFLYWKPTH